MSYKEKINAEIDKLDLGKPIFDLYFTSRGLRIREESWRAKCEDEGFYQDLVESNCRRQFDSKTKRYKIDREYAIDRMKMGVQSDIKRIFIDTSPAKEPKRTKIYKSFMDVMYQNKHNEEFVNSLFDIAEYHNSVTQTD